MVEESSKNIQNINEDINGNSNKIKQYVDLCNLTSQSQY